MEEGEGWPGSSACAVRGKVEEEAGIQDPTQAADTNTLVSSEKTEKTRLTMRLDQVSIIKKLFIHFFCNKPLVDKMNIEVGSRFIMSITWGLMV